MPPLMSAGTRFEPEAAIWMPLRTAQRSLVALLCSVVLGICVLQVTAELRWLPCTYSISTRGSTRLNVGEAVCSSSGDVQLALTRNKLKLVWADARTTPPYYVDLWAATWEKAGFSGRASYADIFDGELCVMEVQDHASDQLWCTGTRGSEGKHIVVQDEQWWGLYEPSSANQLVFRAPAAPPPAAPAAPPSKSFQLRKAWVQQVNSHTKAGNGLFSHAPCSLHPQATNHILAGYRTRGVSVGSYLAYEPSGDVVLYRINYSGDSDTVIWRANTQSATPFALILQKDGNLVAYNKKREAYWASGTGQGNRFRYLLYVTSEKIVIERSYDPSTETPHKVIWTMPQ